MNTLKCKIQNDEREKEIQIIFVYPLFIENILIHFLYTVNPPPTYKSTRQILVIDDNLSNNNAINQASTTSSHYTTPSSSQQPHLLGNYICLKTCLN